MVDVAARLQRVKARMAATCDRIGRDVDTVRLLAVAKNHPPELVEQVLTAGHLDIGENYVQELLTKQAFITQHPARWHFIGRLQSNKVRQIVGRVEMIHSVDRIKLLNEIEKRAAAAGLRVACLLEVNVGDEETKGGAAIDEAMHLLEHSMKQDHIDLRGLMSIPPFLDDPEEIRPYHKRLASLAVKMREKSGLDLPELSMGMSLDMEVAIEEGATIVRVGTDIFGQREYT